MNNVNQFGDETLREKSEIIKSFWRNSCGY